MLPPHGIIENLFLSASSAGLLRWPMLLTPHELVEERLEVAVGVVVVS